MIRRTLAVSLILALLIPSVAFADGPWTIATAASGSSSILGDTGGVERELGQTFRAPGTGVVSAFKVTFGANAGSPSGVVTWKIAADYLGLPGFVLASGTFTPTASADNTITLASGPTLTINGTYWIYFSAADQSTNVNWTMVTATTSTYADGTRYISADREVTWTVQASDQQLWLTINGVSATSTPTTPADTATPADTSTPTTTPSPTPNYLIEVTSTAGAPMALERTATYGDLSTFGGLLIVAGVLFFIFVYTYWRDRARASLDS